MTKLVKPDISVRWAELGDNTKPLDSYIQNGWEAVKPPRQYFNWLDNRQDSLLAYINQAGIPEWDDTTAYEGGFSYVQGSDNKVYKCLADSTGDDPTDQPANAAFWELAFADKNDFDAVEARVDTLETQMGDGSGVTNPTAWRTALSVPSISEAVLDTDFTGSNQSISTNGYQKLPGGLIMQWGTVAISSGSSVGNGTITFPIPWPNSVLSITGSPDNIAQGSWSGMATAFLSVTSTSALVKCDTCNNSYVIAAGRNVRWMAIGY